MNRITAFLAVSAILALPATAARAEDKEIVSGSFAVGKATFAVAEGQMTVTTPALQAVFRGMTLVQVTDRRRGVSYFTDGRPEVNAGCHVQLRTYKPGVPHPTLRPWVPDVKGEVPAETARTRITRTDGGLRCEVRGLTYDGGGDPNRRRFYKDAAMGIDLRVDAGTGDLLIRPFARTGVERKFDVYDEGLDSVAFAMGTLRADANLLLPRGSVQRLDKPLKGPGVWAQHWLCPLLVVQEPARGACMSIWAEDRKLLFGKRYTAGPMTTLISAHADAPWKTAESDGPTWRLNVHGGWMPAAKVYRDYMAEVYGLKPIEQQKPDWISRIRVICWDVYSADIYRRMIDAGCPPESILDWRTQGWMRGYGKHKLARPNWPLENPTHYEARDILLKRLPEVQALGVKTFPYTILFYNLAHQWLQRLDPIREPARGIPDAFYRPGNSMTGAGKLWWVLYTNLCKKIIADYDMAGIYDDVSCIAPNGRDPRGYVDGLNVYQSHVAGRKYMRRRLPDRGWMGERQHEITLVSDHVALLWRTGVHHPINAYLFSPYSIRWNQQTPVKRSHAALDADETLGAVAVAHRGMPNADALDFDAIVRARTLTFCRQQLVPIFPETYEPGVRFYFRGKDGETYKVIEDHGVRFARFDKDGEHTVYWRVHGSRELPTDGALPGWTAYGPDGLIGLDPSQWYVLAGEHKRPPVVIRSLPADAHLAMSKILPGALVVRLAAGDPKAAEPLLLTVAGPADLDLTFLGAASVKRTAPGTYAVTVRPGEQLAAVWERPDPIQPPAALPAAAVRQMGTHGLVSEFMQQSQRSRVWTKGKTTHADVLLTLPAQPVRLVTTGTRIGHGLDMTYRVLVNGRAVHEVTRKGTNRTVPIEVSLAKFAGQTIVLTLASEDVKQSQFHSMWDKPRLLPVGGE